MSLLSPRESRDAGRPRAGLETEDLVPLVYDELRELARAHLRRERPGHTLQATALVHEVYLRLAGSSNWRNRGQFVATAAETIRRVLVNHAKAHQTLRRGEGRPKIGLEPDHALADSSDFDLLALDRW